MSKLIRIYTGEDAESHIEHVEFEFNDRDGTRTTMQAATGVTFARRLDASFIDFHPAPRRQYVLYLSATVEIGLGDGSTVLMEPGDVLMAEDTTGRGHTSRVLEGKGGLCAFVPLGE
jgi:hypothetical protein